ncbi:hypothetical protein [Sphingomonas sp.]|uniref:hypothetical protein n=1 Tax=Sphingomonas sp. TaxID=28214 RepID=UPI001B247405|nr:hypothetical protein [Sphingomonas sp.]MBO9712022.1 hypothetical protein [Sphingomonas sp.]
MSLLLALLLQAAPAPTAIECGATALGMPDKADFDQTALAMSFALIAANESSEKDFVDRFYAASQSIHDAAIARKQGAGPSTEACRNAWPVAWRAAPIALPQDRFERAQLCSTVASMTRGLADVHGQRSGDRSTFDRLTPVADRFAKLTSDDDYHAHGIYTADDIKRMVGQAMSTAAKLGSLTALTESCITAFPE